MSKKHLSGGRLPDFMIIGAAKSGTTTLHHYLCQHPDIFMSTPKEPTFFGRPDRFTLGMYWYRSLFFDARTDQLCGEASTNYTNWPLYPECPERIHKYVPSARFIYIMRQPVKRAYSHYVQLIKNAREEDPNTPVTETFEDVLESGDRGVLESSNYMIQIEQYLRLFSKDRFLFLLMEDLIGNPAETLKKIFDFLEIDNSYSSLGNEPLISNSNSSYSEWLLRSRSTKSIRKLPGVEVAGSLIPKVLKDRIYKMIVRQEDMSSIKGTYIPDPMLEETRVRLHEYYQQPNKRLEEFLGCDLSMWNPE